MGDFDVGHDFRHEFRKIDSGKINPRELFLCESRAIRMFDTSPSLADLSAPLFIDDPRQTAVVAAATLPFFHALLQEFLGAPGTDFDAQILSSLHGQHLFGLVAGQHFLNHHDGDLKRQHVGVETEIQPRCADFS